MFPHFADITNIEERESVGTPSTSYSVGTLVGSVVAGVLATGGLLGCCLCVGWRATSALMKAMAGLHPFYGSRSAASSSSSQSASSASSQSAPPGLKPVLYRRGRARKAKRRLRLERPDLEAGTEVTDLGTDSDSQVELPPIIHIQ